jgi:DNA-binding LacI/PurR family transcriptional regulator
MSAPTIAEVARLAGVAKSTVSKCINGTGYVSPETRDQINRVIASVGYRPNGVARALKRARTDVIGVLVANISNPFYSELIEVIHRDAAQHGMRLLLATDDGLEAKDSLVRQLMSHQVDGIIMATATTADRKFVTDIAGRLPVVLAARHIARSAVDYVTCDNATAARLAVKHLIELGHRRIAYVSGPLGIAPQRERLDAYRQTLAAAGLVVGADLIIEGDGSQGSGLDAMTRLWSLAKRERPTAIIGGSDLVAIGAMQGALQLSISVPNEISLIGFDNISICDLLRVPLTTIDVGIRETGQEAVKMLRERISAEAPVKPQRLHVQPKLVIRESTGSP